MIPLEIPKRGHLCSKGKETLTPGSEYYSVLVEDTANQRYQRQDFCLGCWELQMQEKIPLSIKSHWKAKVPLRQDLEQEFANHDEKIFAMLREELAVNSPASLAYAFVLALYLARKKQIFFRQELTKQNHTYSLYEVAATEEILSIQKVSLSLAEIQKIQKELTQKWKK